MPSDDYLISLGDFIFSASGTSFGRLKEKINSGLSKSRRAGYFPFFQATEEPASTFSIAGFYLPALASVKPLMKGNGKQELEQMIRAQQPVLMILGDGSFVGYVIITSAEFDRTLFLSDGTAQRVDFVLELEEQHE